MNLFEDFTRIRRVIPNSNFSTLGDRVDYRSHDRNLWLNTDSQTSKRWKERIPRLPISVSGIILIICLAVFLLSFVAMQFVINYLALIPAYLSERPWTLITYMFVHVTFDHLFWNMLFLFFFGIELERRLGEGRFLGLYLISGIVAALAQIFF